MCVLWDLSIIISVGRTFEELGLGSLLEAMGLIPCCRISYHALGSCRHKDRSIDTGMGHFYYSFFNQNKIAPDDESWRNLIYVILCLLVCDLRISVEQGIGHSPRNRKVMGQNSDLSILYHAQGSCHHKDRCINPGWDILL